MTATTTRSAPALDRSGWGVVTAPSELREMVGEPVPLSLSKMRHALHDLDREWLAASPFCVVGTADAVGNCDVSPKGDPAGHLAHVLDDHTIALAERPGNHRVDGYLNVLSNPHVGLLFFIPGRNDTLRINGRASVVRSAPFFDALVVRGHKPVLALVVEIDEVFHHCPKAFQRSGLWKPEHRADSLPSIAAITKAIAAPDMSLDTLEQMGARDQLYRDGDADVDLGEKRPDRD
jgi:PPOX class probable FMN-dependent enzyme